MRPWPQLAAKTGADELCDDTHVFFRQTEHLREHAAHVEDCLRLFVECQLIAFPNCDRCLQLDWVVRLGRRDISLIEFDGCVCERCLGIAALALQSFLRAIRRSYFV